MTQTDDDVPLSPFVIDISELLGEYEWGSEEYTFEERLDTWVFDEIVVQDTLKMDIQVVRREYGVEVRVVMLETTVDIPDDGIENKPVYLYDISREYHLNKSEEHTDDVWYIDKHEKTVDLTQAIEQEILIHCLV